jgi:hypothetical protein
MPMLIYYALLLQRALIELGADSSAFAGGASGRELRLIEFGVDKVKGNARLRLTTSST